jgi:PAS domain-containing protein
LNTSLERKISLCLAAALVLLLAGALAGRSHLGRHSFAAIASAAVLAGGLAAPAGFALRRDLMRRRQAEDAMRSSGMRYRALFNARDGGICAIDVIFDDRERPIDYRFLVINASFEKQTGLASAVGMRKWSR